MTQGNADKQDIQLYESKHHEGDSVKEHHHKDYQILYALEDTGKIIINGKRHAFNQDHVAIISPLTKHSIQSDSKLTVLVLQFNSNAIDPIVYTNLLKTCYAHSKVVKLNPTDASLLRQLLRKMLFEQSHKSMFIELSKRIYLGELLLILARAGHDLQPTEKEDFRAERIRQYIDSHYFEITNANDISTKLRLSARHINSIFKKQYKITPLQYLTDVRILTAKRMLEETDKDIVTICFEVGFESLSTFYRLFKDNTQMSPYKYRMKNQFKINS